MAVVRNTITAVPSSVYSYDDNTSSNAEKRTAFLGRNSSSTTVTTFTLSGRVGSTGASRTLKMYFKFDVSSIPANATIESVTMKVKGRISTLTTTSATLQLCSGTSSKDSESFATTTTTHTLTGTFTRSQLNNVTFGVVCSNSNASGRTIYLYGADLTVVYTVITEQFMFKSGDTWTGASTTYKKVNGAWVEQTNLASVADASAKYRFAGTLKDYTLTNMTAGISGTTGFTSTASGFSGSPDYKKDSAISLIMYGNSSKAEVTATSTSNYTITANHKYYIRLNVYFRGDSSRRCSLYWPVAEPPVWNSMSDGIYPASETWTTFSKVTNRTAEGHAAGSYPIRIDFDCDYKSGEIYADGLMVVDLTATFGSGNEPTAAWCDANIPYFTGSKTISIL